MKSIRLERRRGGSDQLASSCFEAEAGTYALEMALMMPLYLMLVFGFTSVALLLFVYGEATYASRAAVRYATANSAAFAKPCTALDVTNSVSSLVTSLMSGVSGGQLTVSSSGCSGQTTIGALISVTVQVSYPVGLPYFAAKGITLSSTAGGYILH